MPDRAPPSTRRQALGALAGTGAAAALGLLLPRSGFAQGGAPAGTPPVHVSTLGGFGLTVVSDGTVQLPMSFLLPATPKTDADALLVAHGHPAGGVTGQMNVTVLRAGDATIVVDCGAGADFMPTTGRFADNFEKTGIAPESVTHVIFTHAHADHLWGVIDPLEETTRFPKARHLMAAAEIDYWLRPGIETEVPEAMKGMAIGIARRLGALKDRLETIRPGTEVAPGVSVMDTSGHTPGHLSVLVRSGSEQVLIGGDVLSSPVFSFARPDWPWGPDTDRDRGAATRRRTLDMLATDRIGLIGYHLPWPGAGRVERKDGGYRFVV